MLPSNYDFIANVISFDKFIKLKSNESIDKIVKDYAQLAFDEGHQIGYYRGNKNKELKVGKCDACNKDKYIFKNYHRQFCTECFIASINQNPEPITKGE